MANKNVILVDENDDRLNPYTTAEQVAYIKNGVENNVKQELLYIEEIVEQYE